MTITILILFGLIVLWMAVYGYMEWKKTMNIDLRDEAGA